jgi:LysM repeat protein
MLAKCRQVSILRTNVRKRISSKEVRAMQKLGAYQLTDPRRLVRAVMVLVLAVVLSIIGITGSVATDSEPAELTYITVSQGDSLWSLAEAHVASQDPRDWIAEVVMTNALTSADLIPGQQIALP